MINKLDLSSLSAKFHSIGICFIFGTGFSRKEWIDACFNVTCVLHDDNVDFLGGYLVVAACYLVLGYCWLLLLVTWWLLLVTAC